MRSILRRTVTDGPESSVRRSIRRLFRNHVRMLAIVVVVSLLVGSLPAPLSSMQRATTAHAHEDHSLPAQLYRSVSKTVVSIGSWMASFVEMEPSTNTHTYQPVAAYFTPAPPFIDTPTNLTVTAASSAGITLSWTAPSGTVDHYVLERSENVQGPFFFVANVTGATTKNDTSVTNLHAYLYRVRAVGVTGVVSAPSNMALGTAISFQFSNLQGQEIRAQHFYDLRTAINLVRALGNVAAESWDRVNLGGLEVEADDVNEMRTALNAGLTALSIPVTAYDDATLTVGATLIKGIHIEQLQTRSTRGSSNSSGPIDSDSSTARLDPLNGTGGGGENPLSRNFNWTLPLLSLPGRAGLNLDLSLSYNSLVWTKTSSSVISFDDDNGFPGPGFRLGFPVIQQPAYFNAEAAKQAFLLIAPDGKRTELRQVGSSTLYEAADSSYLLFDADTRVLRTTDGTQLSYTSINGEYKCTQIKDRNGNFITVDYLNGRLDKVIDTLGREINFNYDTNGWLTSITQIWNDDEPGEVTHIWASFEYSDIPIDYNFGAMTVFGLPDQSNLRTLTKVTLPDGSHSDFSYNNWGQVWKVSSFAPNHLLTYRSYDLSQTTAEHSDCPRFTARRDWAQYWNGDTNGTPTGTEEAVTSFAIPESDTWNMPDGSPQVTGMRAQVTTPDGVSNKIYFAGIAGTLSGWQRGLTALVNTYDSGGVLRRQLMTSWEQDDDTSLVELNPRVKETSVFDPAGNRARTETTYQQFTFANGTSCQLPRNFYEYAANATTRLRSTQTDYNTSTTYTDRRIIGLVSERRVYDGDVTGTLVSKVAFNYDESNSIQGAAAPVQHDNTNYASNFVSGRGNVSSVNRHNVTNSSFTITSSKYNAAGSIVSSKDALNNETVISYTDSFSDGATRNTLAYQTTVTDPGGFSSTTEYHFDFGAVTKKRTPKPNESTNILGPTLTFTFDTLGRPLTITNSANSASTTFEYKPNENRVDTLQTIEEGQNAARTFKITDGNGRVIATATDHPNSDGGFSGQKMVYDVMGRLIKTSNPTETTASGPPSQWNTDGDDESAGWIYTEQTYDWKGRPLVSTNQDGTTRIASYSNCGCAGGEVVTLTDEGTIDAGVAKRRQRKIYKDILRRTVKTEILNWEGGSVYSTTVNTYNARDQITVVRQYAGAEGAGTFQDTTMAFDGYGRLETRHAPEQDENKATTWAYNADDSIQSMTDARGAATNFGYNSRRMVTSISWAVPTPSPSATPIPTPAPVTLAYDIAGNRTSMTDGFGNVSYEYTQLSQLKSETRTLTGVTNPSSADGKYKFSYDYNLGGQVKKFTDATNMTINYAHDLAGRLSGVTGADTLVANLTNYASGFEYRAGAALKQMTLGNQTTTIGYDARLQPTSFDISGNVVHQDYDYYADGRISYVHNTTANKWDRSYKYDHVSRVTSLDTGGAARGDSTETPLIETFEYNQFDDITGRLNESWSNAYWDGASYTNHRRSGWDYDEDGRVKAIDTRTYTYDAAGRVTFLAGQRWTPNGYVTSNTDDEFDGDGHRIKGTVGGTTTFTTYYLRSTVFGAVVQELGSTGQKIGGFVFTPTGTLMASQLPTNNIVMLTQLSPIGASQYQLFVSTSGFGSTSRKEFDPAGALIPQFQHNFGHQDERGDFPGSGGGSSDGMFGSISSPAAGCTLDGVWVPCSMAYRFLESGAARVCPNNDCSPRRVDIDIRYQGGATQRISGLIADPFAIPDGYDHTFRGDAAQAAARAFNLGMANGTFGTGAVWAINAGNAVEYVQTTTPEQRARFGAAFNDMLKRLEKPECAKALGGLNTVFDKIGESTFGFKDMGRIVYQSPFGWQEPVGAEVVGTTVSINSNGAFMAVNSQIKDFTMKGTAKVGIVPVGTPGGGFIEKQVVGGDIALSTFILTHEVGHRTGRFVADTYVGATGVSPISVFYQAANNAKIFEPCGFGK